MQQGVSTPQAPVAAVSGCDLTGACASMNVKSCFGARAFTRTRTCARSWVEHLEDWMALRWNASHDPWLDRPTRGDPRVRVANGAVPGTYSSYMSVCYNKHVPQVRPTLTSSSSSLHSAQALLTCCSSVAARRPGSASGCARHLCPSPPPLPRRR